MYHKIRIPIILTFKMILTSVQVYSLTGPVVITVDIEKTGMPMRPVWAFFGADEPNYSYMKDGRKLLQEFAELSPVPVYMRTHNLLTTGDGTPALKWGSTNAYREDEQGHPVYSWKLIDSIFDTYIRLGIKPLVEIGFMPEALSIKPVPYKHEWAPDKPYNNIFTGWAYPPKDYERWAELVFQWVKHSVERYGEREVITWWWELWNEPNIGYWQGSFDEYCKLYDYTADAVKRACPEARIGGPHATGPGWNKAARFLAGFLEHCIRGQNYATGKTGSPLDYIGFHAKGNPALIDGHIRMNMATQLNDIERGFQIIDSFPELRHLPVIIGECDPEGCAACSQRFHPQNAYRNGTMYSSYTAASFARIYELGQHYSINLEGIVSWSFEFEDQPWFDGFRDLATNGVDKPVLNVFRMYGMMQGNFIEIKNIQTLTAGDIIHDGVHGEQPDIGALATSGAKNIAVMVWNYHDDDLPGDAADVKLMLQHLPTGTIQVSHYRIDQDHSNSYEVWKQMGSPIEVSPEQYQLLESAGKLKLLTLPYVAQNKEDELEIPFSLPRQGVSLVIISW